MSFCQADAGFFHESDVKIIAKSIRDRVALIQWRRQRICPVLQPEDRQDPECSEKLRAPQAQQIQATYLSHAGHPHNQSEPEEPETDQLPFQQNLPTSVTSVACKLCWFCSCSLLSVFAVVKKVRVPNHTLIARMHVN